MLTPGLQKTIEATGINVSALDAIRFTPGVLGKASFVAAAAVFSIAAVAVVSRDFWVFLPVANMILLIFIPYFFGSLWFAHRHPGEALLEGAHLIQWRQLELAAKGMPQPPPGPAIEDPERPPPLISSNAEAPDEP